ncbi:PREDICTED: uncharacterized protein LOC101294108 [Fragaria vesca subsp. vesca]|uniref:uncharacterized protein LOC101294108 n=1 Tax=Fragaria vesca subsp. vesca TaxID=101020 RepID=UPI0002C31593|nr:PREDICTED: uncharacterized protein LOC101294108 [Fragaria vesca subsp. vesca]
MLQSRTVGKNKKMNTIKTSQPRPQTRQQSQAQSEHAFATPTRTQIEMFGEAGQDVSYAQARKTRGITQGLGTQALINACKQRIPIRPNGERKLPQTVRANVKFRSEIGIQTRQNAPLMVKRWKEVTAVDKEDVIKGLAIKFDFDYTDPVVKKFIDAHMAKSYSLWRSRLNQHYKQHAYDPEYARAHPPLKLFHNRKMAEWEWLCDELFTDEDYQKRCKINSANRNKQEYDHLESLPPYPKLIAVAQEMPVESTKKDSEYDEEEDDVDDNGIGDDDDDDNDVDYNVHDDYAGFNDNVDVNDEDDVGGNVGRNVEVEVDNAEEHGNQSVSTNTEKSSEKRKLYFTNVHGERSKKRHEVAQEQRFTDSAPLRANDEVQSASKEVSDEKYLMQCFGILNKMDEIDDDSYSKALKLFRGDPTWRKLFVGMPEKRRKNFILNLYCT